VGHESGLSRQRGSVALYLLFSIAASVAAGYAVYLVLRDRKQASADDHVADVTPARPVVRSEPMPPPPAAEPVEEQAVDAAEQSAVAPNLTADPTKDNVLFGTPGIAGGLEVEQVERTIKRYSVRYERCMRRAKERGVIPRGELRVTLVLAADGKVDYAVGKPTNLDEELAVCVVDVIDSLRFDKSSDGAKVKVVYPMAFAPRAVTDDPLGQ
jgi:hypothetical protein